MVTLIDPIICRNFYQSIWKASNPIPIDPLKTLSKSLNKIVQIHDQVQAPPWLSITLMETLIVHNRLPIDLPITHFLDSHWLIAYWSAKLYNWAISSSILWNLFSRWRSSIGGSWSVLLSKFMGLTISFSMMITFLSFIN